MAVAGRQEGRRRGGTTESGETLYAAEQEKTVVLTEGKAREAPMLIGSIFNFSRVVFLHLGIGRLALCLQPTSNLYDITKEKKVEPAREFGDCSATCDTQ